MPSSTCCQSGWRAGAPLASRRSSHSPVASIVPSTSYSQVLTLRPPRARLLTVTGSSKRAPIAPPQPRGQGVCPLATVESPAIQTASGGKLAGSALGVSGSSASSGASGSAGGAGSPGGVSGSSSLGRSPPSPASAGGGTGVSSVLEGGSPPLDAGGALVAGAGAAEEAGPSASLLPQ